MANTLTRKHPTHTGRGPEQLEWSAAAPLHEQVSIDFQTGPQALLVKAFLAHQIDGSEPFVCEVSIEAAVAASELLPAGATVERTHTSTYSVHLLAACGGDAHLHIAVRPRDAVAMVSAETHARAAELASEIRSRVPSPRSSTTTPIRTWHMANHDRIASLKRSIEAPAWPDIARNYTPRVRTALDNLFSLSRPASGGKLILWHGEPGTGKTTALRALLREWEPWCAGQYIEDPEEFFTHPSYIAEVLSRSVSARYGPTLSTPGDSEAIWRLVIAEDADQYLRATARRDSGAALGRLLNLADGILGQGFNTLVLLTTNEELSRLHPAIIRPGRCLALVEFDRFHPTEAQSWLPPGISAPAHDATVAELYELAGSIERIDAGARPGSLPVGQYL